AADFRLGLVVRRLERLRSRRGELLVDDLQVGLTGLDQAPELREGTRHEEEVGWRVDQLLGPAEELERTIVVALLVGVRPGIRRGARGRSIPIGLRPQRTR